MIQVGPLTSVADAQRRAKRRLPRPVYLACIGGRGAGHVLARNEGDLGSIALESRVGDEPIDLDLEVTLLDQRLSMPLLLAPIGAQALRTNAETQATRAAARAGTTFALSNVASQSLEDLLPHNPNTLAQLYWGGSRDHILERIHRYRDAGAAGLIVTMDWSKGPGTDWAAGTVPPAVNLATMAKFAPSVAPHPRWWLEFLSHGELPTLEVPQFATKDNPHPLFAEALEEIENTPQPRWDDVAWIKEEFGGPLMVKGVFDPDDARRAVDAGADAISVSNHGGNTFDDKQSSISALPRVAAAIGDQVDVVMDGGVRRGSDVVKALGLGAKAVMIGRGYLWPLVARGEKGVSEILEIYRSGIEQALRTIKVSSVADVRPEHVLPPHDARRSLSAG